MVNAALQHAAAVAMGANLDTVVANGVEDELGVERAQLIETLLDDMIAVQVLDELNDLEAQSIDNDLDLLGRSDELDHPLQSASAVLVQCNTNHILRSVLNENGALLLIAILQQLLAEVVTERIGHQLSDMLVGLQPDHVDLLWNAILKLFLEVAATMLILAERIDLTSNILEREIMEAAHGCAKNGQKVVKVSF
jgi:hypothetical protein